MALRTRGGHVWLCTTSKSAASFPLKSTCHLVLTACSCKYLCGLPVTGQSCMQLHKGTAAELSKMTLLLEPLEKIRDALWAW